MNNNIINLGIMAHVDAGKTTVTESLLYHSGMKEQMGSVDKGTTTTDSLELEQKRGITIKSTTISFEIDGVKINLIDTPGHMDFIAEVERSLAVLDGVILVISAKEGVQPQTRIIFHHLRRMKIPVIIFINKIDRIGSDLNNVYEQIRKQLTDKFIRMQEVIQCGTKKCSIYDYSYADEKLTEQIILSSEKLLEKYMNEIPISDDEYSSCIGYEVQKAKIYPIYHGSALQDIGIKQLMHGIPEWFVKTRLMIIRNMQNAKIKNSKIKNSKIISRKVLNIKIKNRKIQDSKLENSKLENSKLKNSKLQNSYMQTDNEQHGNITNVMMNHCIDNLSAYIYKIEWDDKHHKKAYFKVFTGELRIRDKVNLCRNNSMITIKNMYQIVKGKQIPADRIIENDIGIIYDDDQLRCGDFLGSITKRKGLSMSEPLLHVGIRPLDNANRSKFLKAMDELMCEDPLLSMNVNSETKEITVNLFGKLQKEILQSILMDRYKIETCFDDVKTICKEKPVISVVHGIRRGQPGNMHYAGIELKLEPLDVGSGFLYETKVSFGFIEKSFQNAVQEGVKKGIKEGLQYETTDVKVTFTDADYDSVMSTPADYRRLAPEVVKQALRLAGTKVMEPYMRYSSIVPMGYEKSMMTALTAMKAYIESIEYINNEMQIRGVVPYDTCKDFQVDLLSMTDGKGIFELEFLEYREVTE